MKYIIPKGLDAPGRAIKTCQILDGPLGKVWRFESSADWDRQRMAEAIELLYRWGIDADHVWRVE